MDYIYNKEYDVPDFLKSGIQYQDEYDVFNNYNVYISDYRQNRIEVNNSILKNTYYFNISRHITNPIFLEIACSEFKPPKKYVQKFVTDKSTKTYFVTTTKDKLFFFSICFTINDRALSKDCTFIITRMEDVYIDVSSMEKEDFLIVLDNIFLTDEMRNEIIDLFDFIKMDEYEYLKSDKKYFTYDELTTHNDISIYTTFNFSKEHYYISDNYVNFIFTKNNEKYIPETLEEYVELCYIGNKKIKNEVQYNVDFEIYKYREASFNYDKVIQININDIWMSIPKNFPNIYYDEYSEIKEMLEKRKMLFDKLHKSDD